MPKLGRRGSYPLPVLPDSWMEVAAPLICDYLVDGISRLDRNEFWLKWCSVCKAWNSVVVGSREVAVERLMCDSSMNLRLALWKCVLGVSTGDGQNEFTHLLLEGSYTAWSEISRDSRRTYASILRKRPDLHLQLTRVLHALTTRFKDIGYCQGMNFVAGTALLAITSIDDPNVLVVQPRTKEETDELSQISPTSAEKVPQPDNFMAVIQEESKPTETLAFKICEKLFMRNHFIRMYELGLHTRLTIWTFEKLVESLFPDLHEIVTNDLQVSADFYASSWFITLFTSDLDFSNSIRILDLFIAKGPKSLHRFGLACISNQITHLLGEEGIADPAEGLKTLRGVAVNAVREVGIEKLILSSITEFKCVTNQLIADLQTTGKVHGGAQLLWVKDQDSKKRTWAVVPMPGRDSASDAGGDSSPSGAAFEAEWNKEEAAIRAGLSDFSSKTSKLTNFFGKMMIRRGSKEVDAPPSLVTKSDQTEEDVNDHMKEEPKRRTSKTAKASKALKSFGKKITSILPTSSTRGYSRGGFDE